MTPGEPRLTLRLMDFQAGLRLLRAYAWSIAITGLLWLAFTGSPSSKVLNRVLLPSGTAWFLTLEYARGVSVALIAVGGALLAHAPLAERTRPLLDCLSRRFDGVSCEQRVRPLHGALLLARLTAIIPCCTAMGLLVLLVSAMVTPFGWFFDEVLLLPALLIGLQRADDAHRALWPIGLLAGAAFAELVCDVNLTTPFYIWTTPAWLAWYLYASGRVFSGKAEKALPQH